MSDIDWTDVTANRTCLACGSDLEDSASLETLADLRYNSQGFAVYVCPKCHTELSVQECNEPVYQVRRFKEHS